VRTAYFSEILFSSLQFCGLDRNLTTLERFSLMRDFASRRLQRIWESNDWPELKKYTQCTTSVVTERRKINLPANVGQVLVVWSRDPLASTHAIQKDVDMIDDGMYLANDTDDIVWIEHRPDAPILTGDPWNAGIVYRTGAQVYYDEGPGLAGITNGLSAIVPVPGYPSKGDFWTFVGTASTPSVPPDVSPDWQRVKIPRLFSDYLSQGVFSDYSRAQGNLDVNTLGFIENRAEDAKEHALDQVLRQQGNTRRINFRGY
jgi:hypothetical protein